MGIPTNPVVVGAATKKSDYDDLYNGSVLANTGGTPGGAQSIPGNKTFSATTTFNSGILASGTSSVFALSNKINLRAGFVASGTCTYYAPVSGEKSGGTYHWRYPVPTAYDYSGQSAVRATPVTWTLDVPDGTTAVWIYGEISSPANTTDYGFVSLSFWDYDEGAFNIYKTIAGGGHMVFDKSTSSGALSVAGSRVQRVRIGSSKKLYCGFSAATSRTWYSMFLGYDI